MTAQRWVYAKAFSGEPTAENLQLEEVTLLPLSNGDIKIEALFLSVDPYMRPYAAMGLPPGSTMIGQQVARVIESKNDEYAVGTVVLASVGWRTCTVLNPATSPTASLRKVPDIEPLPLSYTLGLLGMTGMTAYFGFLDICQPKPGETVLVNGAAGAVGHVVGQLAKIKGCNVVAYAGTDEKCQWLKEELGFDHVFNYKTSDLSMTLKQAAPEGIDCYFDNVGGEFSHTVLTKHMKKYGRVAICGAISTYNNDGKTPQGPYLLQYILGKELSVRGFIVSSFSKEFPRGFQDMAKWISEGKIKTRETLTEGIENMREAFYSMLKGGNIGKALIKVKDASKA